MTINLKIYGKTVNVNKVLLIAAIVILSMVFIGAAHAEPAGYSNVVVHNITGGDAVNNYVMKLVVFNTSGVSSGNALFVGSSCQNDFDDIVINNSADTVTFPRWIDWTQCNATSVTLYYNITSGVPAGGTLVTVYYGNPSASNPDEPHAVFRMYDNFTGSTINTTLWYTAGGNGMTQSGTLRLNGVPDTSYMLPSVNTYGAPYVCEYRGKINSDANANMRLAVAIHGAARGYVGTVNGYILNNLDTNNGLSGFSGSKYAGSSTLLWDTAFSHSTATWYRGMAIAKTGGVAGRLYNDAGTQLASGTSADTTYTSGYIVLEGFGANTDLEYDYIFMRNYTANEPQDGAWSGYSFSSSCYSVNDNAGSVTITVSMSNFGAYGSVNYATADGGAYAGYDYTATSGTLNFNPGDTTKTFAVPVQYRNTYYGTRSFNVTLSSPVNGSVTSPSTATVTIVDTHAQMAGYTYPIGGNGYRYIYCSNWGGESVSVLDPISLGKITDIRTRGGPLDVVVNPAGTLLYVSYAIASGSGSYVDVFNTVDYSHVASIRVSSNISNQYCAITMNDDGTRLYVDLAGDQKVLAIDVLTNTIIDQVSIPSPTWGLQYYNGYIYVASNKGDFTGTSPGTVWKIDSYTLNIMGYLPNASVSGPGDIVIDKSKGMLAVLNNNGTITSAPLSTFSPSGVIFSSNPFPGYGISYNTSGYIFAGFPGNPNSIVAVYAPSGDTYMLLAWINTTFSSINDVYYDLYNNTLWVTRRLSGDVYVYNANTLTVLGYTHSGNGALRFSAGVQATPFTHSVKFVAQSTFGIFKYSNVNVVVYDQNDNLLFTGKTDDNGQVAFYLNPTTNYRLWFYSQADNIDVDQTITPYDDLYFVAVKGLFQDWNPFGWFQGIVSGWTGAGSGSVDKDVTTNYTVNTTANPRLFTINYGDKTASTSSINFTLMRYWQANNTYTVFNTTIIAGSGIGYQQLPVSVPVGLADGQSWRVVVTSQTTAYGVVVRNDDYRFPGVAYPIPGLPLAWYPYICFALVFIVGIMFTYISSGVALLVLAALSLIFVGLGWVPFNSSYVLLLQVIAVFGVGQIFKMRKQREGV